MKVLKVVAQLFRQSTNSTLIMEWIVPEDITYEEWNEFASRELSHLPGFTIFSTQFY